MTWLIPPLIFAGWQLVCPALIGQLPIRGDTGSNTQPSLVGFVRAWPRWLEIPHLDPTETDIHAVELAVLAIVVIAALGSASRRAAVGTSATSTKTDRLDPPVVATACAAAAACCFSTAVWASRSDLRMFADTSGARRIGTAGPSSTSLGHVCQDESHQSSELLTFL